MLIALVISSNLITEVLVRLPFFSSISNNIVILAAALALATAKIFYARKFSLSFPALLVAAYATLWYLYTLFFHYNDSVLEPVQFIFYAIIPIYAISQKASGEYVLRYILYLGFASLPFFNVFFTIDYEHINQAYLSNMYAILTLLIAAMIHFSLYRRKSNIAVKASYIYNAVVLFNIFLHANRGAVFCLLFCFAVLIFNSFNGEVRGKLSTKKTVIILLMIIAALLVIVFFHPIMLMLQSLFSKVFHTVPSFITKMLAYIEVGDISDGRSLIDDFTIRSIGKNPLFGYGIKTFKAIAEREAQRSWPYPHQYIYQYLFEGGFLFGLIPVYLSLSLTAKTLFRKIRSKDEFALCCTVVCVTLPKLLFSTDAWTSTTIWMLITYSLIYILKTRVSGFDRKRQLAYGG